MVRTHTSTAGGLVREIRSCKLCGAAKKKKKISKASATLITLYLETFARGLCSP